MTVDYAGKESVRTPSPALWKHLGPDEILLDGRAFYYFNDFNAMPIEAEDATIDISDDGAGTPTFAVVKTELGGVVKLAVDAQDNTEAFWTTLVPLCNINTGNGEMAFEACFQVSGIADNACGLAIGLVDSISAGATVLQQENTSEIVEAAVDFIGFSTLQSAGSTLRGVHKDGGTATTALVAAAATLEATTWTKVGLYFDGASKIDYYVGNTKVGSVEYDATNFPEDIDMFAVLGVKTGSDASFFAWLDWVKCVQMK